MLPCPGFMELVTRVKFLREKLKVTIPFDATGVTFAVWDHNLHISTPVQYTVSMLDPRENYHRFRCSRVWVRNCVFLSVPSFQCREFQIQRAAWFDPQLTAVDSNEMPCHMPAYIQQKSTV